MRRTVAPAEPLQTVGPFAVETGAELETPILKRAWGILAPKRAGRQFLSRGDIDPAELVFALPHVMLIEVHRDPLRFRHRLVGTAFRGLLGFEATGVWVEEWPIDAQRDAMQKYYASVLDQAAISGIRHSIRFDQDHVSLEVLHVPLARNGRDIDMLFTLTSPVKEPAARGR